MLWLLLAAVGAVRGDAPCGGLLCPLPGTLGLFNGSRLGEEPLKKK